MDIDNFTFKDIVDMINNDLGTEFCDKFRYERKKLSNSGRASSANILFKFVDQSRDWVINEGGGVEIQYHLYYRQNSIGYGLGFNAQYVPFANEKSPVDYIRPFVSAFLQLKNEKFKVLYNLESNGFTIIEGNGWDGLNNIEQNDYYLFGKTIQIQNGVLSDMEYNQMLKEIKNELFDLYVAIWEKVKFMDKKYKTTEKYVSLLKANKNLILTGAPGTGKTYLAKQIAAQMILGKEYVKETASDEEKENMKGQYEFVQFHPSYDYTDFVEGLRPIKNAKNEQIGFERKDGVFKEFCSKAVENLENSKKQPGDLSHEFSVKEKYNTLLSKIENEEITEIPLKTDNKKMVIDNVSDNKNIRLKTSNSSSATTYIVSLRRILKLSNRYPNKESLEDITNISEDIRNAIGGCNASAYWAVLHLIYEQETRVHTNISAVTNKPYVFIIDEINRGEISKIFGELFFSIDPGYRGTAGKVQTQYQNLIDEDDEFYDGFYVPENVYIIGTMNDIDRSVESMDFAFRRRFAFKEIKANENVGMLDGLEWKDKAIERMTLLNEEIEKIEGLSSAYHIGASYFLKLTNYDGDFNKLWDYHLEDLLREYLRGMQDVEGKIKQLKEAYGYESDSNNG